MKLRIADLDIEVPYELLEDARYHVTDYLAPSQPLPSGEGIKTHPDITVKEDICELGEQLPLFDRMIVHGVAIAVKDEGLKVNDNASGFIFTAASGVGKSTHAFLWQRLLGKDMVSIINGDKPIVASPPALPRREGAIMVYGTPWCGKEGLHKNIGVPLKGIALLHRLDEDHPTPISEPATKEEWADFMMDQTFLPHNPEALHRTFEMLEQIYNNVPVYNLYADMSKEAVELSVYTLLNN